MAFKTKTMHGYECARCERFVEATGPFDADKPTGYFIRIERVTEAQRHYVTDEVFLCDKDCLVDFVQYGISSATAPWRPIGATR